MGEGEKCPRNFHSCDRVLARRLLYNLIVSQVLLGTCVIMIGTPPLQMYHCSRKVFGSSFFNTKINVPLGVKHPSFSIYFYIILLIILIIFECNGGWTPQDKRKRDISSKRFYRLKQRPYPIQINQPIALNHFSFDQLNSWIIFGTQKWHPKIE